MKLISNMTFWDRFWISAQYIGCLVLVEAAVACRMWLDGDALNDARIIGMVAVSAGMLFTASVDTTNKWTEPITFFATTLVLVGPSGAPQTVWELFSHTCVAVALAAALPIFISSWNGLLTALHLKHRHCQLQEAKQALEQVVQFYKSVLFQALSCIVGICHFVKSICPLLAEGIERICDLIIEYCDLLRQYTTSSEGRPRLLVTRPEIRRGATDSKSTIHEVKKTSLF
ncbi:hypothetical protein FB45DRAFT_1044202 [Roridomyces roridus]|uniref:Uncharacterized protein n=1 Tax=Roridomyces roridus TaxID=1738132 RepID=A0AAD7AY59_9AGAR|nr:hypothetical protein FB45DRAFT_1044202 [Roridomyces roridus]